MASVHDKLIPRGHLIYKYLSSQMLLDEWFFSNRISCLDCSLKAYVKGYAFKGWIKIRELPNGTFAIIFYTKDGKREIQHITKIKKKDLIKTLRANIDGEGDFWAKVKKNRVICT